MIVISFETDDLQRACGNAALAEQRLGRHVAEPLMRLVADAEALERADELIELYGQQMMVRAQELGVLLGRATEVRLVPVGTKVRRDNDGSVQWATVTRLKVVELVERQQ